MTERRFAFRKLVRDGVPDMLRNKGVTVTTASLSPDLAKVWLKSKLNEEADEASRATTVEALKEELADVMEVVLALGHAYGLDIDDIEDARLDKYISRGGFKELSFISEVSMPVNSPEVAYFTARREDFPELTDAKLKVAETAE